MRSGIVPFIYRCEPYNNYQIAIIDYHSNNVALPKQAESNSATRCSLLGTAVLVISTSALEVVSPRKFVLSVVARAIVLVIVLDIAEAAEKMMDMSHTRTSRYKLIR